MIKEFQKVRLKTGEEAVIVEILQKGRAFLADVKKADLEYETDEITADDIASVFVEVETPMAY
jgi:predicted DNA-binding antitoxin AbrB/MazE fold protein